MHRYLASVAALALGWLALLPAGPPTPVAPPRDASDEFFEKSTIPWIRIELDPPNLELIKKDPRKYVRAKVKEDNNPSNRDVGLHLKGAAGSFRDFNDKPALTLNMDKFVKGQRFHALDKLHLNNSVQDGTYLSEAICGELMRKAGVPAARTTHAVVELNGRKLGIYVLKEGFDKSFLRRYFTTTTGNLYDGGFLQDINAKLKNSSEDDVPDQADLKVLVAACEEKDPNKRFERVEKLIDMNSFISLICVEVITWHWDGYAMKNNNYRIYHDPSTNKLTFFAHGMDQMFQDPNGTIRPGFSGMVARAVIDSPEGKKRYDARFREIVASISVPEVEKRVKFYVDRMKPVVAEHLDKNTANNLEGGANDFKNRFKARLEHIDRELKKK